MFKQISAVSLSAFYLLICIGFSVSVHHCSGMNETTIDLMTTNSCCCDTESSASDCCSNEEKVIQWGSDQQLISSFSFQYQMQTSSTETSLTIIEETESDKTNMLFIDDPPLKLQKAFIFFQQMTFYG